MVHRPSDSRLNGDGRCHGSCNRKSKNKQNLAFSVCTTTKNHTKVRNPAQPWASSFFVLISKIFGYTYLQSSMLPNNGFFQGGCSVWYTDSRGIFCGRTELTEVFCTGIKVVPNLPKCRVPVLKSYRTSRVSGAGIDFVPNHTGLFGRVLRPYRTTSVGKIPPGVWRNTLTGFLGTGIEVVPELPKCRVPVSGLHRTIPDCAVGYWRRPEPIR